MSRYGLFTLVLILLFKSLYFSIFCEILYSQEKKSHFYRFVRSCGPGESKVLTNMLNKWCTEVWSSLLQQNSPLVYSQGVQPYLLFISFRKLFHTSRSFSMNTIQDACMRFSSCVISKWSNMHFDKLNGKCRQLGLMKSKRKIVAGPIMFIVFIYCQRSVPIIFVVLYLLSTFWASINGLTFCLCDFFS